MTSRGRDNTWNDRKNPRNSARRPQIETVLDSGDCKNGRQYFILLNILHSAQDGCRAW